MKSYPRVLLFGHSFNNYTGMGITLTNLFAEWPKENIAVWANNIDTTLCEVIRPCAKYIGNKKKYNNHGVIKTRTLRTQIRDFIKTQYYKTGIHELIVDTSISKEELSLAMDFNPEIVFCALGSDASMRICQNLMDNLPKAELVLYIVDDWVNTRFNTRYFASLWRRKYDKDFRRILKRANGLLSICQYMSDEYNRLYGRNFYPFHNPVNLSEWESLQVEQKYSADKISILYVGKINADTRSCLKDMSNVVESLNNNGGSFVFDIYSPDYYNNAYIFEDKKDVHVFPTIAHEDIPRVMKGYSALFLPLGFSKQSRMYVRLSMPTKLSEYLASSKPIILYCPEDIALAKYLTEKYCAIICTTNSEDKLKEAVIRLQDSNTYKRLVKNSLQLAYHHDVNLVRKQFKEQLSSFLK